MKKAVRIVLIIEVQILLVISIYLFFKLNDLQNATNTLNLRLLKSQIEQNFVEINQLDEYDIVIGNDDAPVTMIVYMRFDCPSCHDFFANQYPVLKKQYIESGQMQIVLRNLVHPSKPQNLILTKSLYLAHKNQLGDDFIQIMSELNTDFDSTSVYEFYESKGLMKEFENLMDDINYNEIILQSSRMYRANGIRQTPTFFINNLKLIGNRNSLFFEEVIESELKR